MRGRIVEITGESRHLSLSRGFLVIKEHDLELGRLDMDTVLSVMVSSRGATITNSVFGECAQRLIPVVICDTHHKPVSITMPIHHHSDQNRRYHAQALLKQGPRNRLWQSIVKAKIANQAAVLNTVQSPMVERLKRIRSGIKTGDTTNGEATAAQIYWRALFGPTFRRNHDGDGINVLLNYGYAIIRSAMTKSILASGMHPVFGLHHQNRNNAFCFVDDLMEPYRPLVDQLVQSLKPQTSEDLTLSTKAILAGLVNADVSSQGLVSPLTQQMGRFCQTILDNIEGRKTPLAAPDIFTPVELVSLTNRC